MKRHVVLFAIAACHPETSTRPDADPNTTVKHVDCALVTPTVIVQTAGLAYDPTPTQITTGQIVQFVMPAQHDVSSDTSGLAVDFGATSCLAFPEPGTYTFKCSRHGFMGTVVVSP